MKSLMTTLRRLAFSRDAGRRYIALADQVVVSGTSFALSIVLARLCPASDYGFYVLALSVMLAISGLQAALLTDPLMFICPSLPQHGVAAYVTSLFAWQCLLAGLSVAGVWGAALWLQQSPAHAHASATLAAMGAALLFLQFKEFFRRILFSTFHIMSVLIVDSVYALIVLIGILLTVRSNGLTPGTTFLVCSMAGLASAVIAAFLLRYLFDHKVRWEQMRNAMETNWGFGRWQLLGMAGSYGYLQANTFIVAGMLGTVATASLHATLNLLMPIQLLLIGAGNFAAPAATRLFRAQGRTALNHFIAWESVLLLAIALIYGGIISVFPRFFLALFYGDRYAGEAALVRVWCVVFLLFTLRRMPSIGLTAMRRPDIVVWAGLAAGLVALILYVPLISTLDVAGAIWSRAAAELVLGIAVIGYCFKKGVEDRPVMKQPLTTDGTRDESTPEPNEPENILS